MKTRAFIDHWGNKIKRPDDAPRLTIWHKIKFQINWKLDFKCPWNLIKRISREGWVHLLQPNIYMNISGDTLIDFLWQKVLFYSLSTWEGKISFTLCVDYHPQLLHKSLFLNIPPSKMVMQKRRKERERYWNNKSQDPKEYNRYKYEKIILYYPLLTVTGQKWWWWCVRYAKGKLFSGTPSHFCRCCFCKK